MDAPNGSYVAYSTAPGQTAADGAEGNSPFTAALAKYLGAEGLEIRSIEPIAKGAATRRISRPRPQAGRFQTSTSTAAPA